MTFTCHHCNEKLEGELQMMIDHLKLCPHLKYMKDNCLNSGNDPDLRLKYEYEQDKWGRGKYYRERNDV